MKITLNIFILFLFVNCATSKTIIRDISSSNSIAEITSLLKKRFSQDLLLSKEEAKIFFITEIPVFLNNQRSNGSFEDIDYNSDDNKFSPGFHPARMDYLARAYKSPEHIFYNDPKVKKAILKAFDYWIKNEVISYNWWHNTIGVPQRFAKVMILMEDELGNHRINQGIKILEKSEISKTGQNRLWYSEIVFIRSLFDGNSFGLTEAASEFYGLVIQARGAYQEEGIQSDFSFHQHGKLIYNGGYGAKFSLIVARLINILDDTPYEFPKDKIKLFSEFILDSQIWMTRSNKWDYSVTGREITRKNKNADILLTTCKLLKDTKLPRKNEFKECFNSLSQNQHYLIGNKAYWRSDYMLQQRKEYFSSLRMFSNRTVNNDAPSNSEGLMSHYLANGTTFFMVRGDEYENIFPVWDWNMLPGTTAEVKNLKPAFYEPGNWDAFEHIRYMGNSNYVGVTSSGQVGFGTMDFKSNKQFKKVDIRKSYFYSDIGLYVLGDKISCDDCKKVASTIDQKLLNGAIYLLMENGEIVTYLKDQSLENVKAIYHDEVIYYFPKNQSITLETDEIFGSWNTINGQYDNEKVSKKIFKLYITHQDKNLEEEFSYGVFPNKKLEDLKHINLGQLNINANIHSYSDEKYEMLSFFESGEYSLNNLKIKVNKPCALILDKINKRAYVSDPRQISSSVLIEINHKDHRIQLPQKEDLGKTISFKY